MDLTRVLAVLKHAYLGHMLHAGIGAAVAMALVRLGLPWFVPVALLILGLHEFLDGDFQRNVWNGAADAIAFWPLALWVLPLAWGWTLLALFLYAVTLVLNTKDAV